MPIVLDGTNGINTPDLESAGPISGTTGTFSGAVSGTTGTFSGALQASGVTTNIYPLVSATAVSASGTAVDFTGIPSWVKRITVMFSGVSTNGTSLPQIQLGDAGGVETSGYTGTSANFKTGVAVQQMSAGFTLTGAANWGATFVFQGNVTLMQVSGNIWSASGVLGSSHDTVAYITAGSKTLSDVLDRVRITTVNGTDTFDAGTINIMYE